jgi:ATP-dependent Clp protease adaptor protein ClpS
MNTLADIQFEEDVMVEEIAVTTSKLILHNDDINTFEWVIDALLIEVCKHTHEQAEQCSYIIHSRGKYAVKHGSFERLKPMRNAIIERGINATIE